jgi:endoglucanase
MKRYITVLQENTSERRGRALCRRGRSYDRIGDNSQVDDRRRAVGGRGGERAVAGVREQRPENGRGGELLKYWEALGYQARTSKVTTMLWDTSSFIDRGTYQWRDPDLMSMIMASWTTRSGTASSDVLFLPKSGALTAQTLTLNPNGTTFQALRQGNTELVKGTDYTISGDQLTLTPALLTRLAGNRAYGVNATLQARFSQGDPWPIDIRTYDTPVLSNATETTSSFSIPAQFRGDLPATMESKYADGSTAGPATWTPYQMFRDAWYPDVTGNVINLTTDFFNAINDGAPVTLTFHYWSGASVTYQVTKSGSTVTGSP